MIFETFLAKNICDNLCRIFIECESDYIVYILFTLGIFIIDFVKYML